MKRILIGGLIATAAGAGALAWLRREEAEALRAEIAWLADERRERQRWEAANARLRAEAIAPAERARLEADRAAVSRLRADLEALRAEVEKRERAITAPPER